MSENKILILSRYSKKHKNLIEDEFYCTECLSDRMHWQKVTNNKQFFGRCACIDCKSIDSVNDHKLYTLIDGNTNKKYLVPICQACYDRSDNKIRVYARNAALKQKCQPWQFPKTDFNEE